MGKIRREDALMKHPALRHLSRMGYEILSSGSVARDRKTNILTGPLREALGRINGREASEPTAENLVRELGELLNRPDLGEAFYRALLDGWKGRRLMDWDRPERNCFQAAAEVVCAGESGSFRPDITLFVNGLPLGMIELKGPDQKQGIRAEYDRMRDRFANAEFRRFLQCAQVIAFSDGQDGDPGQLLPTEGTFCATGSRGDFPLIPFRSGHPGAGRKPGEERTGRAALLPATRSMLDGLFRPDRFLFLLRRGIRYEREAETGNPRKRLATPEQLSLLRSLEGKIRRGCLNCALGPVGIGEEDSLTRYLVPMLEDLAPGARICRTASDGEERAEGNVSLPPRGVSPAAWARAIREEEPGRQRIYLLPVKENGYEAVRSLRASLRRADPGARIISWTRRAASEGGNYTYLLQCADGTLYCGWTNDLARRVRIHNEGRGARYTRGRRPVRLVYYEEFDSREEAMSREWHLKKMSRAGKERLIRSGDRGSDPRKEKEEKSK